MDIVNSHFRKFYPADWDTAWEQRWCVNEPAREYAGDRSSRPTIFPAMVCADGFTMSVQGHFGAYSRPRDDFAPSYAMVEISTKPRAEPLFVEHGGTDYDEFSIYGYVPVSLVEKVIEKHGGLADVHGE